jgi:hypothetical protein
MRVLAVRLSACVPPGVGVKGVKAVGMVEAGVKRIRWSREGRSGVILVG